jgi:DNA ligase (NAD+)
VFKTQGMSYIETQSEDHVSAMIRSANDDYYNAETTTILSDNEYDVLKEYVERTYPSNPVLLEIGAPITKGKVALPESMPSMNKIKPDTGALEQWVAEYTGPYCITPKMDGVSGMYIVDTTGSATMYTRGNGTHGQDVSHLIPFMNLPTQPEMTIRGEFEINRHLFAEKYGAEFKNPRNFVSGVINMKARDSGKYTDIDFVVYEVIRPGLSPSDQFAFLDEHGINHVPFEIVNTLSNDALSKRLVDTRANFEYETDGIIVSNDAIYPRTDENPKHSFAFKQVLSEQVAEAKVLDVEWAASKDGLLKPRVRIEPVSLGGVVIEHVTGFNAKYILENKIGVGALISLVRSGDVIPHILAIIQSAEHPLMPDVEFLWNATGVDAVVIDAETNPAVRMKRITGFFKTLDVEGMGPGNVRRLIAKGFDTIPKTIHMTIDDFLSIDCFRQKTADKLFASIRDKLAAADMATLMAATNLFGRGFGVRRLRTILVKYPDIMTSGDNNTAKTAMLVQNVEGIAAKTAAKFVANIDPFIAFLGEADLLARLDPNAGQPVAGSVAGQPVAGQPLTGLPLSGKRIVMTGFRDKLFGARIESMGGEISATIGKSTDYVVVKTMDDVGGASAKLTKARELGIPVIDKETFDSTVLMGVVGI